MSGISASSINLFAPSQPPSQSDQQTAAPRKAASATAQATPGATAKQNTQDPHAQPDPKQPASSAPDSALRSLGPYTQNAPDSIPPAVHDSTYSSVVNTGYNVIAGENYTGKWTRGMSECLHGSTKKALTDFTRNTYSNSSPEALAVLAAGTATGVASGLIYSTRLGAMGQPRPPDEFNDIFGTVLGGAIGLVSSFGLNYRIRENMIKNEFGGDIERRKEALRNELTWLGYPGTSQSWEDGLSLVMLDPMDAYAVSNRVAAVAQFATQTRQKRSIVNLVTKLDTKQIVRKGEDARTLYVQDTNPENRLNANEMDTLRFGLRVYAGPTHWGTPEAAMMIYNPQLTPLRSNVPTNDTVGFSQTGAFDNVHAILNKCGVNPAVAETWHHMSRGYQVYLATHSLLWAPKSDKRWPVSVTVGLNIPEQDFVAVVETLKQSARSGVCTREVGRLPESTVYAQLLDETKPLCDIGRNPDQWFNLDRNMQNFLTTVWGFQEPPELSSDDLDAILWRASTIQLSPTEIDDIRVGGGTVSSEALQEKLQKYNIKVEKRPSLHTNTLSTLLFQAPRRLAVTAVDRLVAELMTVVTTSSEDMQSSMDTKTILVSPSEIANADVNQGVWYMNRMYTLRRVDSQGAELEPAEYYYDVVSLPERIPEAPSVSLSITTFSVTIGAIHVRERKLDRIKQSKKDLGNALVQNVARVRDIVQSLLHAYMVAEPVPSKSPTAAEMAPPNITKGWSSAWTDIANNYKSSETGLWPVEDHWVQSQNTNSHFYVAEGVVEKVDGDNYKLCTFLNYQTDQYTANEQGVFQPAGTGESTMFAMKYCEEMTKRTEFDEYIVPFNRATTQFAGPSSSTQRVKAQQNMFPRLSSDQDRYFHVTIPKGGDAVVVQVRLTELNLKHDHHFPVMLRWERSNRVVQITILNNTTKTNFDIVKFLNAQINNSDEANALHPTLAEPADGRETSIKAQERFKVTQQQPYYIQRHFKTVKIDLLTVFTIVDVSPVLANHFVGSAM